MINNDTAVKEATRTIVLKGPEKTLKVSTKNLEILSKFIRWIETCNHFTTKLPDDVYNFPRDSHIIACDLKWKRLNQIS